jgi:hypothetical protein
VGGLLGGSALVSQIVSNFTGDDFGPILSILGGIGLIVQAIANPEGIATGNALMAKHLWGKFQHRRVATPALATEGAN